MLKGFYGGAMRTVVVPKHEEIAIGRSEAYYFRQEFKLKNFSTLSGRLKLLDLKPR